MDSCNINRVIALASGLNGDFINESPIHDIHNKSVGVMVYAPDLYIRKTVDAMRRKPKLNFKEIEERLRKAADIFEQEVVCGLSPTQFVDYITKVGGLPIQVVSESFSNIAKSTRNATKLSKLGIPVGAPLYADRKRAIKGVGKSKRKGEILCVIAPGNGPGVHGLWPQAVALGYRVIIKPSEREPFTAQRLVASLRLAGLYDYVAFIPCAHKSVETLVEASDLSLIYGSEATVERYKMSPDVLVQGPGRSKIVVGADQLTSHAIPLAFESVTDLGGRACVCTTSILVEGDHHDFARKFANYADAKFKDPLFRKNVLTRFPVKSVEWLEKVVREDADTLVATPRLEYMNGQYVNWSPIINCVDTPYHPLVQRELPTASVTIAPFNRNTDLPALGDTLVLTALTNDEDLLSYLDSVPNIHNLYAGSVPTTWMNPEVPHDGFLAEFLMTTTGYRKLPVET